ncbi:MAG: 16S rRNA (uracil(1498)-N(3))-methyltransferase [Planctomycetota bacterium]|nr:16S rRNA (uracil(1498)-N(3))-methyltransferase [Planctomycetota bacterium]
MARPHRFYLESIPLTGVAILTGTEHRHLSKVLRIPPGETVFLFDGRGQEASGRVLKIVKAESVIEVVELQHHPEPSLQIHLALALTKGKQADSVIRMSTELGVTSIQPVLADRSIVRSKDTERITEKWQRITIEAAKQCGRNYLPAVKDEIKLSALVQMRASDTLRLLPHTKAALPLRGVLRGSACRAFTILIGPEGGFTDDEAAFATQNGFTPVSLGAHVLRVETACLMAISAAVYESSD